MSFPKAKTKRFNDYMSCAPPPGSYDPKNDTNILAASMAKSDRFKADKENDGATPNFSTTVLAQFGSNSSIASVITTPRKALFNAHSTPAGPQGGKPERAFFKPDKPKKLVCLNSADLLKEKQLKLRQSLKDVEEFKYKLEVQRKKYSEIEKEKRKLQGELDVALKKEEVLTAKVSEVIMDDEKKMVEQKLQEAVQASIQQRMNQSLQNIRDTLADKEQTTESLEKYREKLQNDLRALKSMVRELQMEKMDNRELIRHLKGEVFSAEDARLSEKDALFRAQLQAEMLTSEIDTMKKTEEMLNENVRAMTDKYEILESNLAEERSAQDGIREQVELELQASKASVADMEAENMELKHSTAQLMNTLDDKELTTTTSAAAAAAAAQEKIVRAEKAEEDMKELKSREVDLLQQNSDLQRIMQLTQQELSEYPLKFRAERENMQEKLKDLTEKVEECQKLEKEKNESIQELVDATEAMEKAKREEEEVLRSVNERLEEKCTFLQDNITALTVEKVLQDNITALTVENITALTVEKAEVLNKVAEMTAAEVKRLAEEAEESSDQLRETSGALARTQEEKAKLDGDLSRVQLQLAALEEHNTALQVKLGQRREKFESISAEKEKIVNELKETREVLEDLARVKDSLERDLKTSSAEKSRLQKEADDLCEQVDELTEIKQGLEADVEELKQELDNTVAAKEGVICSLTIELEEKEQHIRTLEEQMNVERTDHYNLVATLESSKRRLEEQLVSSERSAEANAGFFKKQHGEWVEKEESLHAEITEKQRKLTEMDKLGNERTGKLEAAAEDLAEKKCEVLQLVESIGALEEKQRQADATQRKAQQTIVTQESQLNEFVAVGEALKSLQAELEEDLARARVELVDSRAEHSGAVKKREEKLHALKECVTELRQREEQLSKANLELTQRYSVVQDRLQQRDEELEEYEAEREHLLAKEEELQENQKMLNQFREKYHNEQDEVERLLMEKDAHEQKIHNFQQTFVELDQQVHYAEAKLAQYQMRLSATEAELSAAMEMSARCTEDAEARCRAEVESLREQASVQAQEITQLKETSAEAAAAGPGDEDMRKMKTELDMWQQKFESLYETVEPFREQLEQFQLEKEQLLGRSKHAQSEVDKLSKEYAKLLGHSNQKQKIKHVMKLKEENNELKAEVSKLRDVSGKQKRQMGKLEEQVKKADKVQKKHDASMLTAKSKENHSQPLTPINGKR